MPLFMYLQPFEPGWCWGMAFYKCDSFDNIYLESILKTTYFLGTLFMMAHPLLLVCLIMDTFWLEPSKTWSLDGHT